VYNGITQVREVLEWRQSAANRKVQPAGSYSQHRPFGALVPAEAGPNFAAWWAWCEQLTQGCYAVCLGRGSNSRPSDRKR